MQSAGIKSPLVCSFPSAECGSSGAFSHAEIAQYCCNEDPSRRRLCLFTPGKQQWHHIGPVCDFRSTDPIHTPLWFSVLTGQEVGMLGRYLVQIN